MTLGEFRNRTAELPDDAELVIVNSFNDEYYGKSAGELTIIPSNSAKMRGKCTNFVSTPGFGNGLYEGFFVNTQSEPQKMNLSKLLLIMKGDDFYVDDFDDIED